MENPGQTSTHTETQLSSQTVYDGMIIRVTKDEVLLENGHTSWREVVHHNGGAAIVAVNDAGEIALVRQFRYALGQELIEIPAGKIEVGEQPETTARRELAEEAGCLADNFVPFGKVIPTCGFCNEIIYLYLATGLTATKQQLDADEFLDVFWLPLEAAAQMVESGEIVDSKTVTAILRAKALRGSGKI